MPSRATAATSAAAAADVAVSLVLTAGALRTAREPVEWPNQSREKATAIVPPSAMRAAMPLVVVAAAVVVVVVVAATVVRDIVVAVAASVRQRQSWVGSQGVVADGKN